MSIDPEDARLTQPTQQLEEAESYYIEESRKVYDPVHGFIRFDKEIWKIIDSPEFQRLREIKQLGALYLVFPSAMHSRFEHCIGTANLCQKYMGKLIANNPERYPKADAARESQLQVTLAGLLHDIGHGPFSHMFDNEFMGNQKEGEAEAQTSSPQKNGAAPKEKPKWSHELAGLWIIDHMAKREELQNILTPARVQRIKSLIIGEPPEDAQNIWEYEIVSNKQTGIDVDRFDYFRRDSFYLGIHNVYVDFDLLMDETRIIKDTKDANKYRLCYPVKYADKILDIFHSRYKLFKGYYQNKIVKGIEIMLCEVFEHADRWYGIKKACDQIETNPEAYCRLTDNLIYEVLRLRNYEDKEILAKYPELVQARDLMRDIQARRIYKFVSDTDDLDVSKEEAEKFRKKGSRDILREIIGCSDGRLTEKDVAVCVGYLTYGSKEGHPIDNVRFYRKNLLPLSICPFNTNKLSILKTDRAQQRFVMLYVRDSDKFKEAKTAFGKACLMSNLKLGHQCGTPSLVQQDSTSRPANRRENLTISSSRRT